MRKMKYNFLTITEIIKKHPAGEHYWQPQTFDNP